MNEFAQKLNDDFDSAARFEHPLRQMRVTLECGHLRLMQWQNCAVGGIGWSTQCNVCTQDKGSQVSRVIVNVEETGVL